MYNAYDSYIEQKQKIFYNRSANSASFCAYSESLSNPLPFKTTQINKPFLNSRISANHDKEKGF